MKLSTVPTAAELKQHKVGSRLSSGKTHTPLQRNWVRKVPIKKTPSPHVAGFPCELTRRLSTATGDDTSSQRLQRPRVLSITNRAATRTPGFPGRRTAEQPQAHACIPRPRPDFHCRQSFRRNMDGGTSPAKGAFDNGLCRGGAPQMNTLGRSRESRRRWPPPATPRGLCARAAGWLPLYRQERQVPIAFLPRRSWRHLL